MRRSTLVHLTAGEKCISLRTVSRSRKSPHWFYILRQKLEDLNDMQETIVHDINSFAVLHLDECAGAVEVDITWLNSNGGNVSGYQETVFLPYGKLSEFLHSSVSDGHPAEWKTLSMDDAFRKRPQIVFKSRKNLHEALADSAVRHKLVRYLRDGFYWPRSEKVEFFDDFMPYSFAFNEIRNGKPAVSGGLILHNADNPEKSYYAIHT